MNAQPGFLPKKAGQRRSPPETSQPSAPQLPQAVPTSNSADHGKNDLFREFCLVWIVVNLIDEAPRRVRRALDSQVAAVMRSIKKFGFRVPLLVRRSPGGERYVNGGAKTGHAAAQNQASVEVPRAMARALAT